MASRSPSPNARTRRPAARDAVGPGCLVEAVRRKVPTGPRALCCREPRGRFGSGATLGHRPVARSPARVRRHTPEPPPRYAQRRPSPGRTDLRTRGKHRCRGSHSSSTALDDPPSRRPSDNWVTSVESARASARRLSRSRVCWRTRSATSPYLPGLSCVPSALTELVAARKPATKKTAGASTAHPKPHARGDSTSPRRAVRIAKTVPKECPSENARERGPLHSQVPPRNARY